MKTRSQAQKERDAVQSLQNQVIDLTLDDDDPSDNSNNNNLASNPSDPPTNQRTHRRHRSSTVVLKRDDEDDKDQNKKTPAVPKRTAPSSQANHAPKKRRPNAAVVSDPLATALQSRDNHPLTVSANAHEAFATYAGTNPSEGKLPPTFATKAAPQPSDTLPPSKRRCSPTSPIELQWISAQEQHAEQEKKKREEEDFLMAQRLADSEERAAKEERQKEHDAMKNTIVGKAVLLVQEVIEMVDDVKKAYPQFHSIEPLARDDMVFLAEQLLNEQQVFAANQILTNVDVGFHYTSADSGSLQNIRTNGLLSKRDRQKGNITAAKQHGDYFGDGIYTGNNPFCFRNYGDVGLFVIRLLGVVTPWNRNLGQPKPVRVNTIRGNKSRPASLLKHYSDEDVLQSPSQCVPLIKFDAKELIHSGVSWAAPCHQCLFRLHEELQCIVDRFLNNGEQTTIHHIVNGRNDTASLLDKQTVRAATTTAQSTHQHLPRSPSRQPGSMQLPLAPMKRSSLFTTVGPFGIGPRSNFPFSPNLAPSVEGRLDYVAPTQVLSSARQPHGTSPSGSMTVAEVPNLHIPIFGVYGLIQIDYSFPNGIQKLYHPRSGRSHSGSSVRAYLLHDADSIGLLTRLKWAFSRGLLFTVSPRATVSWASVSVPHKTSLLPGTPWSLPDPGYIRSCHRALDQLNVP